MRCVDWFDNNPGGQGFLHTLKLRPNELVQIRGLRGTFRYTLEGPDHVLTPVEPLGTRPARASGQHRHFGANGAL